jgi:hypothetical protein
MAARLQIEENFLIVFEDGVPSNQYINAQRSEVTPKYNENDLVRFYANLSQLGEEVVEFDSATIIDDRTGLPWTSVKKFKSFLSKNLGRGFFFEISDEDNTTPELIEDSLFVLQNILIQLKINNQLLSEAFNINVTERDLKNEL